MCIILVNLLSPFNLEKFKTIIEGEKIAKSVHEAQYLWMQIIEDGNIISERRRRVVLKSDLAVVATRIIASAF